jgi:hypothetical protein
MSEALPLWRIGDHTVDGRTLQRILEMERNCRPGLDNRCRNKNGEIRRKNGNARLGTLRETYGPGFVPGIRGDAKLSTVLSRTGARSLSNLIKKD